MGTRRDACVLAEIVPVVDARRTCLLAGLLGLIVVLAGPGALGQSAADRKAELDRKISGLRDDIQSAKRKEGALTTEIEAASQRIDALGGNIGALSAVIAELETDLAVRRNRLEQLRESIKDQSRGIEHLQEQFQIAQGRLEERLIELYQSEETDTFGLLLQVQSLGDLVDQFEYFEQIGRQDRAITVQIRTLRVDLKAAREATKVTKGQVAEETRILARKTAEQVAARDELVAQQNALAAARAGRESVLATVQANRHEAEEDVEALAAQSARLAAQIRASSGSSGGGSTGSGTSSSGFIWPVNGVLTSGFGWRWGRMHEGIDIGVPSGTPIRAAKAGEIVLASAYGGYGNYTCIDHGGGLSTCYAHQSSFARTSGSISQGSILGYVGCTGHCFGDHLHFEVRINGSAVDPLGYL